jgi:hypothetical protein
MAHQQELREQEPQEAHYLCRLEPGSKTKVVFAEPGKYCVNANAIVELYKPDLKIHIYTNPKNPQSAIDFLADVWQNGKKVLTRCSLRASVIPMNSPLSCQSFVIKDDKGEVVDFGARFTTDIYNVTSFTMRSSVSETKLLSLHCDEKLDDDIADTRPAILSRNKRSYELAQKMSDEDVEKIQAEKRKAISIMSLFGKKPEIKSLVHKDRYTDKPASKSLSLTNS